MSIVCVRNNLSNPFREFRGRKFGFNLDKFG